MSSNKCYVCGSSVADNKCKYPVDVDTPKSTIFDSISFCQNCSLGYAVPMLEQHELDSIYTTGDYWNDVVKENPLQRAHERNQASVRVDFCSQFLEMVPGIRVLDIGAGHAYTAEKVYKKLSNQAFQFDFIEHDDANSEYILTNYSDFGVKRISSPNENGGGYDLIFMNHVLEHVANPLEFVSEALSQLRENGVLYIETPALDFRYKSDVFPHTLFFSPKAVNELADQLGAELVCCDMFGREVGDMKGRGALRVKLLNQLFKVAVKLKLDYLACVVDRLIWRYGRCGEDNIWLRWVLKQ